MKRTNETQGRRLPDVDFTGSTNLPPMEPGDYVKILNHPGDPQASNLTRETWYAVTPNGLHASLGNHTVREEDDGSISVKPGDWSSNSILVTQRRPDGDLSWHGYITRGLWWSLA
jgi:hypothetical protein